VDGTHLLLSGAALPARLVRLGAPKDHHAAIGLKDLGVFLLGVVCQVVSLWGRLLGLALQGKGAMDVTPNGGTVLPEVLRLFLVEWVGGLERLLEVLGACTAPTRLRPGSAFGRGHHLLPMVLSVLVSLVAVTLG
jgi:hypothetical protein